MPRGRKRPPLVGRTIARGARARYGVLSHVRPTRGRVTPHGAAETTRAPWRTSVPCHRGAPLLGKFQDYYETLGVVRDARAEDIKQAFRKLARLYHPDVAKNKVTGEAKFKEINEAYEVLGDPEKRRRYDELGADW